MIAAALMAQAAPAVAEGGFSTETTVISPAMPLASAPIAGVPDGVADDAAVLINRGSAYARAGQNARALESYLSAMASDRQYEVRLADGRWMDSRRAARKAADALVQRQALALR